MIPRRLHAFWGGPAMPERLAEILRRWQDLHPEWEFTLWNPSNLPQLRNQDLFDNPEVWSPKSNPWQWRSDLARYELLHDLGGVYIDCDLEPLRPIDDLLGCSDFIAREDRRFVNNSFMGSVPRSDWISDVLEGLRESATRRWDCRVNKSIGAWYLTEKIRAHPDVRVLPPELVYPYHWSEVHTSSQRQISPDAYTMHLWWNKLSGG